MIDVVDFDRITEWYFGDKISSFEIAERLTEEGKPITPRSIQRFVRKNGRPRSKQLSYLIALARGRFEQNIPEALKYERKVMDDYTCQGCGNYRRGDLRVRIVVAKEERDKPLDLKDVLTLCRICIK